MKNLDLSNTMDSPSAGNLSLWSRFRRGLLVTIGCGCLSLGAVLIVTIIRPETLQTLGTLELAAIVGFVVMPALTMICIRYDRLVVKRVGIARWEHSQDQAAAHTPIAHIAHTRGARVAHHARSAEPTESAEPTQTQEDIKRSREPVVAA